MFKKLKRYLGAGILITAPIGITLYLAWLIIDGVDILVAGLIPAKYAPKYSIPGLGFLLLLIFLIIVGAITTGYMGKIIKKAQAAIMKKMPVLNSIFNTLQQIFETVFSNQSKSFKEVVLVEYPIKGMWAMAFVTSDTVGELKEELAEKEPYVNIFLPTTPNPTSGFLLILPVSKVKRLDMSVEEGIKLIISAGIMSPMSSSEKLEAKLQRDKKRLEKQTKRASKRIKKAPANKVSSKKVSAKKNVTKKANAKSKK